ncbi:Hypothetical protein AA314_00232 [Archangium gephyra]|uniref:Uncharacterized protein n=1 Tax=Archangium gephyra TaxID=48 RepID=A0AAC8TBN5_9BACT|nr:Hypothetical protein AA314_00232 [Archangium gephyra]
MEEGGPKRLELSWRGHYEELRASVDGVQVGQSLGKEALRQGELWGLPDGSRLGVRLHQGGLQLLLVEHEGRPVPGSQGHPLTWVRGAAYSLLLACFVHLLRDSVLLRVHAERVGAERGVLPFVLSGAIGLAGLVTLRAPRVGLIAALLLLPLKALTAGVRLTEAGLQFGPVDVVLWSLVFLHPVLTALYMLTRAPTVEGSRRRAS